MVGRVRLANRSRGNVIFSRIREGISREPLAAKVPEITLIFWVIKILTTGMGEAASDYFGQTSRVLGAIVGAGGLALAMWLQLRSRRYRAPTYWFAVGMVAVFGTMAADALHLFLGLSPGLAVFLGLGSVAQAATGLWITRRIAGPGNPLDDGQSAMRTLMIGGPVSCLVGATWGVAALVTAGVVPVAQHSGA